MALLLTDLRWRIVDTVEAERAGVDPLSLKAVDTLPPPSQYLKAAAWAEEALGGGWVAAYRLAAQDGRPVVSEIRIFPDLWAAKHRPPGTWSGEYLGPEVAGVPRGGLSASLLRQVTLARPFRDALAGLGHLRQKWPWIFGAKALLRSLASDESGRRAGRLDTLTLARLAAAYVGAECSTATVAKRFGLSESTVRGRVRLARERGLLARSGTPGVRAGALTEHAEELLKSATRARKSPPRKAPRKAGPRRKEAKR